MDLKNMINCSKITLAVVFISASIFFIGCSKDDEESNNVNTNNEIASCSDGIKNQNETGIDCGGVCPPCSSSASPVNFTIDGEAAAISDFAANRNPFNNPSVIGLIALTSKSDKLTILIEEPAITGWSNGLSFLSLTPPNVMQYDVQNSDGTSTSYSSSNGNHSEEVSFLKLEYIDSGLVKGSFSGVLDDGNGNTISIENGEFNTFFVN